MRSIIAVAATLSVAAPAHALLAAPNAAGVTFAHVRLNVSDIELHRRIWVDHSDGKLVQKGPLTMVGFPGFSVILTEGLDLYDPQ